MLSPYRRHRGRPVSLTLITGDFIEGTLHRAEREAITITGARLHNGDKEATALAGALVVPIGSLVTLQVEATDGV